MNSDDLKAIQSPLKEKYQSDPASARVTLRTEGSLGQGVTCSVNTGQALVEAGLHPATGGDGTSACSGEMLLEALAACMGVTLRAVATALDIPIRGGSVIVEGDLDFRGTLAVDRAAPVGFESIRMRFQLEADTTPEQLATLEKLTKRYCVVYQSLVQPPAIEMSISS